MTVVRANTNWLLAGACISPESPMETNAKDLKHASKVRLLWPIATVCFLSLLF